MLGLTDHRNVTVMRLAIVHSQVSLPVVRNFIKKVEESALGVQVIKGVKPDQQLVKVVNDQLIELMGGEKQELVEPKKGPQVSLQSMFNCQVCMVRWVMTYVSSMWLLYLPQTWFPMRYLPVSAQPYHAIHCNHTTFRSWWNDVKASICRCSCLFQSVTMCHVSLKPLLSLNSWQMAIILSAAVKILYHSCLPDSSAPSLIKKHCKCQALTQLSTYAAA